MAGRQTRGRQRIPIRLIENQDDLYATFSKRRLGIYKKASELSTLCGADVGVIIFSPSNNPFSFFSPSMDSVVNRYMYPNQEPPPVLRMVENHSRIRVQGFSTRLDEVQERKEEMKQRERYLDEFNQIRQHGWWEQVPIENLSRGQLMEWKAQFERLGSRTTNRMDVLNNGGSSSSVFQQQNAPNFPDEPAASTTIGPSTFPPNYAPPGQFSGPNYVPPTFPHPFGGGSAGTSHDPPHFHSPPTFQAPDPFFGGPSTNPFPPQPQDPPQPQNPPARGRARRRRRGGRRGDGGPSNVNP